jgi:hypothetical protein
MRMSSGVAGDLRVECVTLGFVRHPKGAIDPGHRRTPDVYPLNGRALADQESRIAQALPPHLHVVGVELRGPTFLSPLRAFAYISRRCPLPMQ